MADPRVDNESRYDAMAPRYVAMLTLGSFGRIHRLYRAVADSLDVPPGGVVVEAGCGPGIVTPHLRRVLADDVAIHGVDLSGRMIELAVASAAKAGLANVRYEKADLSQWDPEGPVDAVVFSLALTAMPDPLALVDRVLGWLRPGGQLVVLDSLLLPGRRFGNWLVRAKAPAVGAIPEDVPLDALLGRLDDPTTTPLFGGSYVLVTGTRREPMG